MRPVSSLDAAMLYAETPEMPLHTMGVVVIGRRRAWRGSPLAEMRRRVRERIHHVAPFRRRLVEGPLQLGDPHWIEDPNFTLSRHLVQIELPSPRRMIELAAFVGDYAGRPLDRSKPLWEMVLIPHLSGGRMAVVAKIHHAVMDGIRLVGVLRQLFDETQGGRREPPVDQPWVADPEPSSAWLVADAARAVVVRPWHAAQAIVEVVETLAAGTRPARRDETSGRDAPAAAAPPARLFEAPATPFNGALTRHRTVAFADVRFDDLTHIKAALGTTVNDVVLAACTASLRSWLLAHGGLPERPLVANVPVTVRGDGGAGAGNRVSMILAHLPVETADPLARLRAIHAETQRAKHRHGAAGGDVLRQFADVVTNLAAPWLLTHMVQLYSASHLANWLPFFWNLVISNVPGPPRPLSCEIGRVRRVYPLGPVQQGSGLNLTVMSAADRLCLGAMACTELVPDVDDIARGFVGEIAALRELAEPGRRARPRRGARPTPGSRRRPRPRRA
jgi:WS/DGAT/MGAT family acyltransferase